MKIICDEKICVRCLACVSESEFGGVTYERGRIFFDETKPEDWQNIAAICPVGAINTESAGAGATCRADSGVACAAGGRDVRQSVVAGAVRRADSVV